MVWPEDAGIGAAPASRANAASEVMRPWCDQESTSCAAACGPTPGWSSSCVGLAPRAALPPQPAHLEHPLATTGEKARQTSAERPGPLDSEDATPRRVLFAEQERLPVATAVCRNVRLQHDRTGSNVDDRERMRITVRIDTNDVVQMICEDP